MPNYNGEKFLEKSISAFLNSSWLNKELVIVDAKSTDSSHSIIKRFAGNHKNIIWVNELDSGLSDAINIGIHRSTGSVIGYLGSDDFLLKGTLSKVAEYKELIGFDGIYFDSYTHNHKSQVTQNRVCPDVLFTKKNLLKYGTIVGLQNIYFSNYIFDDFQYDVNNKYSMDYELYFRIVNEYSNFVHVKYPSTINIAHENITNRLSKKQAEESFQVAKANVNSIKEFYVLYLSKRILIKFLNFIRRGG